MDLSTLIPSTDTITFTVKHPITSEPLLKDDGKEMTVTLYSPYSKEFKAVMHEQANKRISKAQKSKKIVLTAEEIEEGSLELLAKTTKTFDLQLDKKPVPFSVAKAMEIYSKIPWLKEQAIEAQEDYTSFLKS
jgi:tRNA splicing ligase